MNSYNVNKIAGAVFWSALVIVGSKVLIEEISIPKHPEKPGYVVEIPGAEPAAKAGGSHDAAKSATVKKPAAGPAKLSLGAMLRAGDAARGGKIAKRCGGCHTFDEGGKKRSGPNLYNIVNKKIADVDGFTYSPALKKKGGKWTFAELNCFLTNPKKCISGTKMSFRGIKKPAQVADLLVYLNGLSGSPSPLPK